MARTQGHGNPDWTREETILALALLFECGMKVPPSTDKRIQKLSNLLRRLPYHAEEAKRETFRNPAGVGMKLSNLHSAATGRGLGNSKTDRAIWTEFGSEPSRVKSMASLIEAAIETERTNLDDSAFSDDSDEFFEGRMLTQMHKRRERHGGVRKALLASRRKLGPLSCDLCSLGSLSIDPGIAEAQFEGHHLVPIALAGARATKISDMALVCANCHRLIHRLITHHKRWLDLQECKSLLWPTT